MSTSSRLGRPRHRLSLVNENVIPYCNVKMSSPWGYRFPAFRGFDRRRRRTSPRVRRRGAPLRTRGGISCAGEGIDIAAPLAIVRCSVFCELGPRLGGGAIRRGSRRTGLGPCELGERLAHRSGLSLAASLSLGGRRASWREDEVGPRARLRREHPPVVQDDEAAVEEFADLHAQPGIAAPVRARRQLRPALAEADRMVARDDTGIATAQHE